MYYSATTKGAGSEQYIISNYCKAINILCHWHSIIGMHRRDICFLLFYSNWKLHSVFLSWYYMHSPYPSLKFLYLFVNF